MSSFTPSVSRATTTPAPPQAPTRIAPSDAARRGLFRSVLAPLASLKLTVVLLALSMILIFAGTTAQTDISVWDVQHRYFHSWVCLIEWRLFFPLVQWQNKVWGISPFPGGYALIVGLLLNLIAAHATRFKFGWKRSGILLTHFGLILLLLGEIITSQLASEGQMTIHEGAKVNYIADAREFELAVVDRSDPTHDRVVAIPASRLRSEGEVTDPNLPFAIRVNAFYGNSTIVGPQQQGFDRLQRATAGVGTQLGIAPLPRATGTDSQNVDLPTALLELRAPSGASLGTFAFSTIQLPAQFPQIGEAQPVSVDGKEYFVQLRNKRTYQPFSVELLKFSHDKYLGTDVPKNYSSRVRLVDPSAAVDRETLIWMNHPLRYAGQTFYQASFVPGDETTSILQVVRNPGWIIPYVSCVLVGAGLLVHFGIHLFGFLGRRTRGGDDSAATAAPAAPREPGPSWIPAAVVTGICAIYVMARLHAPPAPSDQVNTAAFGALPVLFEGRPMPIDSLARNSLRILSGKSELTTDAGKLSAVDWLLDVFARPEKAKDYRVFRIDHPDVIGLLALDGNRKLFSAAEIEPNLSKLAEQFDAAQRAPAQKRDLYQQRILELVKHWQLFNTLADFRALHISPPLIGGEWRTFDEATAKTANANADRDPGAISFISMLQARRDGDVASFNDLAGAYQGLLDRRMPELSTRMTVETTFNRVEPFIVCMAMYVIVFVLAAVSWMKWQGPLARAAFWVLLLALLLHTAGLATRIYLQGRPPVTNLYSSAIFIAWGAVAICALMELIFRNAVASAAAAAIAFPSLLIAHYLAGSGDTMQMLQAVLDTNIWLATHVVVITLGYTATFLAGFLAIGYVIGGVFSERMDRDARKSLSRMIYGVVCFAMLFSFVGTVLGGIWADQSWGRFWGWDPKENGAVLIVIWNAIILHARWGGLVKDRGVALLAIFGNIVTAWSWFGTNMLGVGLHSYGFMDSALTWLGIFMGIQILIMLLGSLPQRAWRSVAAG